jgi:hypothetical protein
MPRIEQEGKTVLSTFMENINFVSLFLVPMIG